MFLYKSIVPDTSLPSLLSLGTKNRKDSILYILQTNQAAPDTRHLFQLQKRRASRCPGSKFPEHRAGTLVADWSRKKEVTGYIHSPVRNRSGNIKEQLLPSPLPPQSGEHTHLGDMGHVGVTMLQLLVGMNGIDSWLRKAALWRLSTGPWCYGGRGSCQRGSVVQVLLLLGTGQVRWLSSLVLWPWEQEPNVTGEVLHQIYSHFILLSQILPW